MRATTSAGSSQRDAVRLLSLLIRKRAQPARDVREHQPVWNRAPDTTAEHQKARTSRRSHPARTPPRGPHIPQTVGMKASVTP